MKTPLTNATFQKIRGFTLTELLITVTIIGILAMFAVPAYNQQGQKTRRSDAKVALTNAAQSLERCNIQYDAYNSASCADALAGGGTITTEGGFYTIKATTLSATAYTLTATPVPGGGQDTDVDCTSFTLNQAGSQGATGGKASDCW